MLRYIKKRIVSLREGLTNIDNHPIGKAVLTIVLFLDFFILVSIFQGLDDHTSQLVTPTQYVPQYCRDIVIDEDWNSDNRLIRTAHRVTRLQDRYAYSSKTSRVNQVHPVCQSMAKFFRAIEDDQGLSDELRTYVNLREQTAEIKSELERFRAAYDTSLLEVIAEQAVDSDNTDTIKRRVGALTTKLNTLVREEEAKVLLLLNNRRILLLFSAIETGIKQDRGVLMADFRQLKFWFPVKRLAMELLFLIPLILMFYWWNGKSIRANRPYQSLVSAHLLVIAFIPVIIKVSELLYDIIPRKLLQRIFEVLESFNLVAIWHYIVMAVGIAGALALIYVMQKKIFSHQKVMQKRIAKGLCQECGVALASGSQACSSCGFKQFRLCGHCNHDTYVHGKFCRSCGGEEASLHES